MLVREREGDRERERGRAEAREGLRDGEKVAGEKEMPGRKR